MGICGSSSMSAVGPTNNGNKGGGSSSTNRFMSKGRQESIEKMEQTKEKRKHQHLFQNLVQENFDR